MQGRGGACIFVSDRAVGFDSFSFSDHDTFGAGGSRRVRSGFFLFLRRDCFRGVSGRGGQGDPGAACAGGSRFLFQRLVGRSRGGGVGFSGLLLLFFFLVRAAFAQQFVSQFVRSLNVGFFVPFPFDVR